MGDEVRVCVLALALVLAGCAAPRSNMNLIHVGMAREQVASIMGTPDSSAGSLGQDCAYYSLWRDFWNRRPGDYSDRYYICFERDKVSRYGRVGDPIVQ
jgi:hypothetical protein